MADSDNNKNVINTNPLCKGKVSIDDLLEENKNYLKACTFMSACNIEYNEFCNLPQGKQFFAKFNDNTYLCKKRKGYKLEILLQIS